MGRVEPAWLVYALLVALPFERIPSFQLAGITLRPSILIGLSLIAVTLARNLQAFWPDTRLKQLLYGFLAAGVASAIMSPQPTRAFVVVGFMAYVTLVAISISVASIELQKAWRWLIAGTTAACIFGLYQFVGDLAGLPNQLTGLKPAYSSQIFGFPRIQSTALEPLYLANFLLLPLGIGLGLKLLSRARFGQLTLLYLVFFLTLSRGGIAAAGFLTFFMAIVGWGYKWRRNVLQFLAAGVIGLMLAYILLILLVPILTRQRGQNVQPASVYTRQLTNYEIGNNQVDRAKTRQLAIELFRSKPFFGSGLGTFGYFAHSRDQKFPIDQIANNAPLELLAEMGLVGFGVAAAFGLHLFAQAVGWLRKNDPGLEWVWGVGLLGFLLAAAVQYWSFSTLYVTHLWVGIGLLMGLVSQRARMSS